MTDSQCLQMHPGGPHGGAVLPSRGQASRGGLPLHSPTQGVLNGSCRRLEGPDAWPPHKQPLPAGGGEVGFHSEGSQGWAPMLSSSATINGTFQLSEYRHKFVPSS